MKAMILAAGLGTRLRPLSAHRPKALVPVGNIPVIDRLISYLKGHGITKLVVNAYHNSEQIVLHLDGGRPFGIDIDVRVEPEILGTGGGIKNAEDFWDTDPFIVINGDILTDIDLTAALTSHRKTGNLATLILHNCEPYNQIRIDDHLNIIDISIEKSPGRLAFTGMHILEPEVLSHINAGVFSNIIDCYRELIRLGMPVRAYISDHHYWRDMGTLGSYVLSNKETLQENPFLIGPGCTIHGSAELKDWAVIGERAVIEKGAKICRSILWEDVRIKKGTKVVDSIVTASRAVAVDLNDAVY